jgi:hypothetical protein
VEQYHEEERELLEGPGLGVNKKSWLPSALQWWRLLVFVCFLFYFRNYVIVEFISIYGGCLPPQDEETITSYEADKWRVWRCKESGSRQGSGFMAAMT